MGGEFHDFDADTINAIKVLDHLCIAYYYTIRLFEKHIRLYHHIQPTALMAWWKALFLQKHCLKSFISETNEIDIEMYITTMCIQIVKKKREWKAMQALAQYVMKVTEANKLEHTKANITESTDADNTELATRDRTERIKTESCEAYITESCDADITRNN
ncbi:hypothetical protein KUTeg_002486 [Tegillarca granosa]|uniref:Uncharacterized protein n=1 Tax=Tegillarca granosa TaxID=220873 RepID=A0ABQ9FUF1_TEGGR|nr:hypothetical protein KUTeg_002486 [Tegillarca granosa]